MASARNRPVCASSVITLASEVPGTLSANVRCSSVDALRRPSPRARCRLHQLFSNSDALLFKITIILYYDDSEYLS
jgi:hypothetical protein